MSGSPDGRNAANDDHPRESPQQGNDVSNADDKPAAKAEATAPAKRKKMIVIGAAAAVVLLGGGGGAFMLMGGKPAAAAEHTAAAAPVEPAEGGHGGEGEGESKPLDVPPILVNLRSPDGAPHFLKIHVMLVPGEGSTAETLKDQVPLLLDSYQPFLRELRPEDLSGSAAVFRIKEELLVRTRETIGAGKVKDVLIQDLIQQ